ncbi:hypothetical protein GCM10009789_47940 [Kribbella sancticallisti]|uniref:Uncharacterized protein n=1 Tax=Kribbella sancticallisti TaxID=460087 RepID=A0ABN2DZE7_9ACTN
MKRFVVPPSWPTPPRRSWVPPKTWSPDPSWPAAPDDWKFWVDGKGNPVRGPVGRYGGPSRRVVFAGAGGVVLFLAVNFWALSSIGLFDGDPSKEQALPVVDDSSATPSVTPTRTPPRTTAVPSAPPPVEKTTVQPTPKPTRTKTTTQTEERPDPTPTRTTATRTPRPPRTSPSRTPTREEVLAQYCAARGWPQEWCDPDNWSQDPHRP